MARWLPEDRDGDGYPPPADCDDDDEDVHPDAVDIPYNGRDEDCDGADLTDVDGDGWDAEEAGGEDCADINPDIHPDAEEVCADGRDNDCDGATDEDCTAEDATDPGGISWTCATAPPTGGPSALLPAFLLLLAARFRGSRVV
jgi:hypothetical protein